MEQYKEINGIGYTLVGDYYLPNLLPHQEPERPVGVWGPAASAVYPGAPKEATSVWPSAGNSTTTLLS